MFEESIVNGLRVIYPIVYSLHNITIIIQPKLNNVIEDNGNNKLKPRGTDVALYHSLSVLWMTSWRIPHKLV